MGFFGKMLRVAAVGIVIIAVVGVVIFLAGYDLPKYDWAVVQGTVNDVYQSKQGWYYNISLLKGTNGDLPKIEPVNVNNHHPSPYPNKQNGIWIYIFRPSCDPFTRGDSVYLRIAIQDKAGGFPSGVLGYWLDGDGSQLAPHFMQGNGFAFTEFPGC